MVPTLECAFDWSKVCLRIRLNEESASGKLLSSTNILALPSSKGEQKKRTNVGSKKSVLKNAECPTIALSLTGFEKCPFLRFLCVSWFWRPLLRQCTIWRTKFVLTNVKKKAGAFHPRSIYVQTAKVSIPNAEEFYWILPFWRLISCIRKCNRHSICDCWFKIWCYLWLFLVHPLLLLSIFLTNFLFLVQLAFAIKGTKIHSFQ